MKFEWDERKNLSNQQKHGVDFETASFIFDDPNAVSIQDRFVDEEERWQIIGQIAGLMIALVAHTVRLEEDTEIIRIISARKATKEERNEYEKSIW